ncbi:MAG: hypothetical protein LBJ11_06320 [Oscillospiraceae bacterium]|jgi:cation transport ATPase|nr:hypothetical protein [Oscillospiraceae bacterium]
MNRMIASCGAMLLAGVFGAKFAGQAAKIKRSILFTAASALCFAGSMAFYNTVYATLYHKYDIYPDSGAAIIIPLLLGLAVYALLAHKTRRALQISDAQTTAGREAEA